MKLFLTLCVALSLTATALAEPLPLRDRGGSCPFGYTRSNGFCAPQAGAKDAIPQSRTGECPNGWLRSGDGCLRSGQ
jgi:hypothetical protein